jgi:hypothetical protein
MNKKALSEYALFARKELENQIRLSLNRLGIFADSIKAANVVGDFTIVEGTQETFPKRVYGLRNSIIENHIKEQGFNTVVEEFAYTWFNRIVAIRFLEVHDYLSHGFRVLTSRDGSFEPEILKNLPYVEADLKLDLSVVEDLKTQNKTEELYRYVLFKQCNALSSTLPMLFDEQESYLELLLPANLLSEGSVIRKITDIPEEDFKNDVEVIGWLYQFYNSVKKDEVFASKETITKETLPAVTQLFTPDWIVRYMAQNSIGRIWAKSHPESRLKSGMEYYIEDHAQCDSVVDEMNKHEKKDVSPEDLRILEPCCGSGHILVYAFDLLYSMYLEKGYLSKDIPGFILRENLYGLDVDKRAVQLSQFALMMKARSIDNRFFQPGRIVFPQVTEIEDSSSLVRLDYKRLVSSFGFSEQSKDTIEYLVETFKYGKVIGSLLKVQKRDYQAVLEDIKRIRTTFIPDLLEAPFFDICLPTLERLCNAAIVLSNKYDVVITNPPYCGISHLEDDPKNYLIKNYPTSKNDMFSMFMDTDFLKADSFLAMINMQSWMFLSSYEKLRSSLLKSKSVLSMIHLGPDAFEAISGEVVQVTSFVMTNHLLNSFDGTYIRLVDEPFEEKKKSFLAGKNRFYVQQREFFKIPGKRFIYWFKNVSFFANSKIGDRFVSGGRNKTHNNEKYVRMWWEVAPDSQKWMKYDDGGDSVKWYGNCNEVVDWSTEARDFYASHGGLLEDGPIRKIGISWNIISAYHYCFKIKPEDFAFSSSSPTIFEPESNFSTLMVALAALNSCVGDYVFTAIDPTVHLSVGEILEFPLPVLDEESKEKIERMSKENVLLSMVEWDAKETSPNFACSPLIKVPGINENLSFLNGAFLHYLREVQFDDLPQKYASSSLKERLTLLNASHRKTLQRIFDNEKEIDRVLIQSYGLGEELASTENAPLQDKPLEFSEQKEQIVELVSYLVGLIFGRYSLGCPGVVSNGENRSLEEIIPIYSVVGINDDLTSRFCEQVKKCFGDDVYQSNIDFIAENLGRKPDESSVECINRYFNTTFYDDHLRLYSHLPIYWMFSSGKHGAFKCLMYVHHYTVNTLAKMNSKLFIKRTELYRTEEKRIENKQASNDLDVKEKRDLDSQLAEIRSCEEELLEYGQILDHSANENIEIVLSDGVKANYQKFQKQELIIDGAVIKKDLLISVKSLEAKEQ